MNCKNCGHQVEGKFCSHCGQKANVDRITISNFLKEISEGIFQVNKGFIYTLKELFVRPGMSINEFLDGKRKRHFRPITYLLTLSAVYFISTQITNENTWLGDFVAGWMEGASDRNPDDELPGIASWFIRNYAYSTLLLLPVFSLASYISFFRFRKTYLEHVVINSFITGHQAIFYTLFVIGRTVIENDVMEIFPMLLAILYTFWVFWQLFPVGNRMINILRTISTYLLYMLLCIMLIVFLMAIHRFN